MTLNRQLVKSRILLIDDSAQMRSLLRTAIRAFGITAVDDVADAVQGYDRLLHDDYNIVITDWEMKPVSGLDLIKRVRKHPDRSIADVGIIMITGHGDKPLVLAALKAGADAFLTKPVNATRILERLLMVQEKIEQRDPARTDDRNVRTK